MNMKIVILGFAITGFGMFSTLFVKLEWIVLNEDLRYWSVVMGFVVSILGGYIFEEKKMSEM